MIKVKLLNDGGFEGLEGLDFPLVVEARKHELGCEVNVIELGQKGEVSYGLFQNLTSVLFLSHEFEMLED